MPSYPRPKSLGYRTDLIFPNYDGVIRECSEYLVIETPSNPQFHWGNFLLFKAPPQKGDLNRWKQLFRTELKNPAIQHLCFGWDTTNGEFGAHQEFLAAGFHPLESIVLSCQNVVSPPNFNEKISVRPIQKDSEWNAVLKNQIACRDEIFEYGPYQIFKGNQVKRWRKMVEAQLGHWFGAFIGDQLVGDLGIFKDQSLGRFQNVGTSPKFRRQGICGTLVHTASRLAFDEMNLKTLVMVADDDGNARRVYESVGFVPTEKQSGLSWWPR